MSASSPEELETLLEDAVLLGDESAVSALFEAGAVIIIGIRVAAADQAMTELGRRGYAASIRSVCGRRDLALVVGDSTVNVSRRSEDGVWRLVATVLRPT